MLQFASRKFLVWLVWTFLTFIAFITPTAVPVDKVIEYYGLVSLIYIGGNVAQKFLKEKGCAK